MKNVKFVFAVVFLIGFAGICVAQDDDTKKELAKEWLKYLAGDWDITATYGNDDEPKKWKLTSKISADGLSAAFDMNERGSFRLLGWDPLKKTLVGLRFYSNGTIARTEYTTISEEVLRGKAVVHGSAGDTTNGTFSIHKLNGDSYRVVGEATRASGAKMEWKLEFVRKRAQSDEDVD